MTIKFKKNSSLLSVLIMVHLSVVIFMPIVRSLIFDYALIRDIILLCLCVIWVLIIIHDMLFGNIKIDIDFITVLFYLYLVYGMFLFGYSISFSDLTLYESSVQFHNYFLPVIIFFITKRGFTSPKNIRKLLFFFLIVFLLNASYVICEYACRYIGLDIHSLPWHEWYFAHSDRFELYIFDQFKDPRLARYELPPALGIMGFPHYTAPALVAMFALIFPFILQKRSMLFNHNVFNKNSIMILTGFLSISVLSIVFLSVKTHMVTLAVILLLIPIIVRPSYSFLTVFIIILITIVLIQNDVIMERINLLWYQVTVGNRDEGSRLDIIFRLKEVWFFLDLPLSVIFIGTGDIFKVSTLLSLGLNYEVKFLVYTTSFGLIWAALFMGIYLTGIGYAIDMIKMKISPSLVQPLAVGVMGMLIVYFLEMGHFGQTFALPNIEIWSVLLGVLSVMRKNAKFQLVESKKIWSISSSNYALLKVNN